MKIFTLLFGFVLSAISIGYSQPIDTLWTRTISTSLVGDVTSYEMIKYNSDEFIVAGEWGDSLYVIRLNSEGNIVWQKYYYSPGGLSGEGIDKDAEGNFYVIVWGSGSNQWKLFKFNSDGDSLWSRNINDPVNSFDIPYAVTVSSGYIYVAASAGNGPEKYMLYKFDSDGNSIFSISYNPGGFSIPRSITSDSEGNIILAGTGGIGWYILKCNSDGDTLWSRSVNDNFWNNEARTVITDENNNIICSGWVNKIIKYDPDGNLIYDNPLGGDDNWECASLIKYDPENVIMIGAKRRPNGMAFDLLMGKYSIATGDSIWTDIWNYPEPGFGLYGWDGAVLFDNSLIVLGQVFGQISGDYFSRIYLMSFSLEDVPVPVELKSFTASVIGGSVQLNWSTATEINNKGFEIQRSEVRDQRSAWEKIGFVAGNGTTSEAKTYSFMDDNTTNSNYIYRLKQIDFDGNYKYSNVVEVSVNAPMEYSLSQNYPNPFNPATKIKYTIPSDEFVTLNIYNAIGQKVAELVNGEMKAGTYEVNFDASKLSSGVYYYKIETNGFVSVKKMMLLR